MTSQEKPQDGRTYYIMIETWGGKYQADRVDGIWVLSDGTGWRGEAVSDDMVSYWNDVTEYPSLKRDFKVPAGEFEVFADMLFEALGIEQDTQSQ